ncbi:MAG: helix-turn-helix domain-containing protein [Hahellaceae bacterium]|nr:helix-turn-helix domain-containing protein [Hahellaceae bacterium]
MSEGMNATAFPDVGTILKKARESQGLSVQEAADALHLRPSIVVAIECNEFGEVPGTTFLKGYVKSYARLLKLSESEVLEHLQQALDLETSTANAAAAPDKSKTGRSFFSVLLVGAVLIFAAGFYSWQAGYLVVSTEGGLQILFSSNSEAPVSMVAPDKANQNRSETDGQAGQVKAMSPEEPILTNEPVLEQKVLTSPPDTPLKSTSELSQKLNATILPLSTAETVVDREAEFGEVPAGSSTEIGGGVSLEEVSEIAPPLPAASEDMGNDAAYVADYANVADDSTISADGSGQQSAFSVTEVVPVLTMPSSAVTEPVMNGVDEVVENEKETEVSNDAIPSIESITGDLVATFSGDCWFQVKNGDGKVVLAALKHSGDTVSYSGVLPFQVVIGAVSEVQLTFNGEPVDFNRFRVWNNRTDFILE